MKQSLACVYVLSLIAACGSKGGPATGPGSTGGSGGSASAGGNQVQAGSSGSSAGSSNGGSATGGANTGGTAAAGAGAAQAGGAGQSAGGAAGMTATGFKCPAGPFEAPALTGANATKVAAPPSDAFNMNQFTVVEGPVWIGDSLYFSEILGGNLLPAARLLKLAPGNVVTVVVPDSGSNGLAVDASGSLFAGVHKDGSISQVALPSGAETPLVSMFGQPPKRFNSPNDLAIRSDGTIYFSDPQFQNNANPQMGERLYRITPAPARAVSIATNPSDMAYLSPNGVTLSPDEHTLYVSGSAIKKFAVMADGTLGPSSDFVMNPGSSLDGMVVDCAGNLYVSGNNSSVVRVFGTAGNLLGSITSSGGVSTNVAFGGADHKTLYITAMGTEGQRGVYSVTLNVPGFPY